MDTFIKQPTERIGYGPDFTDRLPTGATVSSATIVAINLATGSADNSVLASTTATISGNIAYATLINGVDGKDYQISWTCTLSDSSILVEDALLKVRKARP